jgi:hypothetical protein
MTHPKDWKVMKLADVGTDERFVRETLELFDLLNGTMIEGKRREESRDAIGTILTDGLIPTFLELRGIRESKNRDLPLLDNLQLYEDFARKLWKTYKDLTQRAVAAMGFDIGFLYQKESKFEEGMKAFRAANPAVSPNFESYFRQVRDLWQNELAQFRNGFLEHQQGNRKDFQKFYDADFVENLFPAVARVIVDILVMLMNLCTPPFTHIVEHNDAVHGPGWPNRFRWVIDDFQTVSDASSK